MKSDKKPNKFPEQKQDEQPGDQHKMVPEPEIIRKSYRGSGKLNGKVALITGGDSGIGRSVAVHFAREGADIAIIYLNEDEDAVKTKELVEKEGAKCLVIEGDLTDPDFARGAVEKTVKKYGKLNVFVQNAAIQFSQEDPKKLDFENVKKTFETNIFPYFSMLESALEHMSAGDVFINTTSVTSYRGSPHLLDYSSTKGAITTFTRSLSTMLAEKKIRVNAVAPGPIWTPLIPATFDKVSDFGKSTPLGRAGQPSEVAPAYVFLACEDSSYITGQTIHVNGGELIGG